jgi:proteasome lid subunit RPN8/RPN11
MLSLSLGQIREVLAHAGASDPAECCGLVGGSNGRALSIYPLQNKAATPLITYEAAPEELFASQKLMRERDEQLLAIYHSHPRAAEPLPSDTDVRLAYYPDTLYLIVGLAGAEPVLRAFLISEKEHRWEEVEYEIRDE